jgi:hypothetical protein
MTIAKLNDVLAVTLSISFLFLDQLLTGFGGIEVSSDKGDFCGIFCMSFYQKKLIFAELFNVFFVPSMAFLNPSPNQTILHNFNLNHPLPSPNQTNSKIPKIQKF